MKHLDTVTYICNCSAQRLRQADQSGDPGQSEIYKLQASLDYLARPHLNKKKTVYKTTLFHMEEWMRFTFLFGSRVAQASLQLGSQGRPREKSMGE